LPRRSMQARNLSARPLNVRCSTHTSEMLKRLLNHFSSRLDLTHYERLGKQRRRKRDAAEPKRTIPARGRKRVKERLNRSVKEYGTLLNAIPDPAAIVDTTEHEKMEEAIRRQADLLRNTFNSMTDAVFILDAKGVSPPAAPTIMECNKAASTIFGYEKTEMLGRTTAFLHVSEENLKEFQSSLYCALEKGQLPFHLPEHRMKRKDGSVFPSEHSVVQILDRKGERIGWVSIVRDITERKKAKEAIERSQRSLEAVVETAPSLIVLHDPDGRILLFNRASEELTGYKREEVIGRKTSELFLPPEWIPVVEKRFADPYAPELRIPQQNPWITKSGEERLIEWRCAALPTPEGGRPQVLCTGIDITDRKRAEEQGRKLTQFLNLVIDSANVWLNVLDEKGNVLIWNKAAESISGYSREEVVGCSKIWEWLYPDEKYWKEVTDKAASVIQGLATDVEDETTIRTKSGEYKIISWHSRNIVDEKGVPIGSIALGHDITERKKMQEQIESLARFPSENPNPVLRLSQDGILLDANEATDPLLQDWGCKVGSVAPKFWRDLAREAVASQSDRSVDLEVGERVYSFFVKPVKDAGYVNLYGTDITERKRMEEILRRSEQEKTAILENMSELVTYLDTENRILWGNRAVTESLGLDLQQVIGRRCYETWHQRKIPCTDCPVNKACKTGQHQEGEITTPDGRVWLTRADPVRDANGEVVGIIEVSEEITERRKMEEELKERNAQQTVVSAILEEFTRSIDLKEILEESVKKIKDYTQCSSVGIRLLDDDGNIPYEAYVGFSTEFYGSESPLSIKSDKCMCINVIKGNCDPSKPFFTANGSFYANGTSKLLATVSEEEKGETRNVCNEFGYESVSLSPIRVGDRIVGLIHVADEKENMVPLKKVEFLEKIAAEISLGVEKARITSKLRESQERLRKHSEQLEELVKERTKELQMQQEALLRSERLAAIGEAAAMVGHDLRNPLQAMVNMLYLGRKRLESIPPQLRELAEKYGIPELMEGAGDQIEYMNKIVSDLQDYAKEVKPKLVETSISGLIDETLSMTSIPENVKISVVVEKGLPKLIVDPALMKRVFTNLVINALEAMPDGGRLKIEASVKGEEALVDFHDTGVGIAEEDLDKMFQPLFTTRAKGMGLGLVVAKRLVEAHGGDVMVHSKVGEGSTFTVKLPLRKK